MLSRSRTLEYALNVCAFRSAKHIIASGRREARATAEAFASVVSIVSCVYKSLGKILSPFPTVSLNLNWSSKSKSWPVLCCVLIISKPILGFNRFSAAERQFNWGANLLRPRNSQSPHSIVQPLPPFKSHATNPEKQMQLHPALCKALRAEHQR